ncbi:UNVERIFIED_ORG: hypothetical protein B5F06_16245 [Lacrimispora saccharolytica]
MDILENIKSILNFIATNLKSEYVALFSVLVTIIIYIFNRKAELKFKKYESQRTEYAKLIAFLSIAFTTPEKLELDENGKLKQEVQQEFYDMGASLMLYASKKLYREYIFFRDFSSSEHIKLSKYYEQNMIIYIVANIMRQIRKEVGLSAFNQISTNESLGFFVNNFATNPVQKNKAHLMNYKIRMLKIELFFMNRFHGVFINWFFYKFIKPVFGTVSCIIKYVIFLPPIHLINKFQHKNNSSS